MRHVMRLLFKPHRPRNISNPIRFATMASDAGKVEMLFFPYVGGGHLIPMVDLARVFASRGAKSTIITAPDNALLIHKAILRDQKLGHDINLHTLESPSAPVSFGDMSAPPFTDTTVLREPLRQLLIQRPPDCVVTDMFHRWVADDVHELGIRIIVFNGSGCFPRCGEDSLRRYSPHEKVGSESEVFVLPGLPDRIELTRSQVPHFDRTPNKRPKMMNWEAKTYGSVVNSFYELEPAYVDYFRNQMGKKAWLVGPVCLCNKNIEDKAGRGQEASIDEQACLNWLDSKQPNSVLYVSFGSLARLPPRQLLEIACALEASGRPFIWVVGKVFQTVAGEEENWLPSGYEERMVESKMGLIIRGWAPQLLILEHAAIGGFVTHCGWNSTLEAVCAGVPMITWPLTAEQFLNEKLVTDVLRVGVRVGSMDWRSWKDEPTEVVGREKMQTAVERLMGGGEEAVEMRSRGREVAGKAKRAVEEGGSSYSDAIALIEELKACRKDGKF